MREDLPGPGQYEPFPESTVNLKAGPRIGREARGERPEKSVQPGPGEYNSHISPSFFESAIGFPTAKRDAGPKSETPGPGHYHREPEAGEGIS